MLREMLKCKIHRATITDSNLNYEGSLTVDRDLMMEAGLIPFEKVKVYNINNGERFDTYIIEGPAGSGTIALNGAAARKGMIGDLIIIASYAMYDADDLANYYPQIVVLKPDNGIKHIYNAENPPPIG